MGKRFDSFLQRLLTLETVFSVVILGFLVVLVAYQVFVRYLFNSPLSWAEELAALLLIYLSFLTGDIVYKKRAHISIDYFVGFFPFRLKAGVALVIDGMLCICLLVLAWASLPLIKNQLGYTTAAALPLPKSFWTIPVPLVFLSMLLTTFSSMLGHLRQLRK